MSDTPRPDASLGSSAPRDPEAATWSVWEAIPVFLIAVIVAGILSIPFLTEHPSTRQQLAAGIVGELALGGTVVAWLYALHRRSMRALGRSTRPLADIAVGLAGGLALVAILVYGLGWILARILEVVSGTNHVRVPSQLPGAIHGANAWLASVLVVVAAPLCEELFFRGMVFKGIRRRLGLPASAAISGVVFGLAHLEEAIPGPWQGAVLLVGVLTFVGGGLAWIYERRGSLATPVAAHAAFNIVGLLVILKAFG